MCWRRRCALYSGVRSGPGRRGLCGRACHVAARALGPWPLRTASRALLPLLCRSVSWHALRSLLTGGFCVTGLLLSLRMCSRVLICLPECFSVPDSYLVRCQGRDPGSPTHLVCLPCSHSPGVAVCEKRGSWVLPRRPAWSLPTRVGGFRPAAAIKMASRCCHFMTSPLGLFYCFSTRLVFFTEKARVLFQW